MARNFKNSFSDILIANPATAIVNGTLRLEVRLPWYRSLPLSVIKPSELTIDGEPVSLEGATVEWEGQRFTLAELADQTGSFWFVQDSIFVDVPLEGPLRPGPHEASLLLHLFPPYIPMLTWVTRGSATVQAA